MAYKKGLRKGKHTLRAAKRMLAIAARFKALDTPPDVSFNWAQAVEDIIGGPDDWLMLLNDKLGDCVIADDLHFKMVCDAHGLAPFTLPTDTEATILYEQIGGYDPDEPDATDNGCAPDDNLKYMEQQGWYSNGGNVDVTNLTHLKWATHIFTVRWCIDAPDFMDVQFDKTGVFDYTGQTYKSDGGHDMRCVGYTRDYNGDPLWQIITWGKRVQATDRFRMQFLTQAEIDVVPVVVQNAGTAPAGMDLDALLNDLSS